jgi:hypothetical protein
VVHKKMAVENIVEGKDCEWFEFWWIYILIKW